MLVHYEWAEPGDPPNPDYASVRSRPLAKRVSYPPITPEIERELIRAYHEDGDLDALDWLVEAHRPMVVRMAKSKWRGKGTTLKALVEYGMLGLRLAAEPPRPSLTKKGKLVGFDPSKGRFSTYARHHADKEMRAALADDPPALSSEFQEKAIVEVESWGERVEPDEETDRPSDLNIAPRPDRDYWRPPKYEHDLAGPMLSAPRHRCAYQSSGGAALSFIKEWLGYAREGITHLQRRRWHYCGTVQSTLWNPPPWAKDQFKRKVRPRNYQTHPRTATELAGRDLYQGGHYLVLRTHEDLAKAGMEALEDNDPDPIESSQAEYLVANFFRSHAFTGKKYRLPHKVLRLRHRRAASGTARLSHSAQMQGLAFTIDVATDCQTIRS